MWHKAAKDWVKSGKLVIVAITQEQHAERCRLFAQWQGIDWPILHDPINLTETLAVPVFTAIDENGIVRLTRARVNSFERDFLDKDFGETNQKPKKGVRPDLKKLRAAADEQRTADAYTKLGDAILLWGKDKTARSKNRSRSVAATNAYMKAKAIAKDDPRIHFRLGVAHRMRFEAEKDLTFFDKSVRAWGRALAMQPNQYIWRRRIQQYGPRLAKPYPFYDWVVKARSDIKARGEEPIKLAVEPAGAEIARPLRRLATTDEQPKEPDPKGKINRDIKALIRSHVSLVPAIPRAGRPVRVHVTLKPSNKDVYWNNEAEPLAVWLKDVDGLTLESRRLQVKQPREASSKEDRKVEFDVSISRDLKGKVTIPAYALYYVCEHEGGACYYLRKDIKIELDLGP